jgi:hypothetical protein
VVVFGEMRTGTWTWNENGNGNESGSGNEKKRVRVAGSTVIGSEIGSEPGGAERLTQTGNENENGHFFRVVHRVRA